MESLASGNLNAFTQAAVHVACQRQPMSKKYEPFISDILKTAGCNPSKFSFYNVPEFSSNLGSMLNMDVHDNYVILDEDALAKDPNASYSRMRYDLLQGAVRRSFGGRRLYDYLTLNVAVAGAYGTGLLFLHRYRSRWPRFRSNQLLAISVSLIVAHAGAVVVKAAFQLLGLGVLQAQYCRKKAVKLLDCKDCLADAYLENEASIEDCSKPIDQFHPNLKGLIPKLPGQEREVTQELTERQRAFLQYSADNQKSMLKETNAEIRFLMRVCERDGKICEVHQGLRNDPKGYVHPSWPVFAYDRKSIAERLEKEKKGIMDVPPPDDPKE